MGDTRQLVRIASDRMPDFLLAWLASSPTGSVHTLRAKLADLEAFGRWIGCDGSGAKIRECAARRLLLGDDQPAEAYRLATTWLQSLADAGYAPRTRARKLATLRGLVRCARQFGLPWQLEIRGPAVALTSHVRGPAPAEIWSALRVLEADDSPMAVRDLAILACLYLGALRRSEVASLRLLDFDPKKPSIRIHGKGDQVRLHTVARYVADAITRWLRVRGRAPGALFCALRYAGQDSEISPLTPDTIRNRCQAAGLGSPHGLRHTAASELARAGRIDLAQKLLRHANLATTHGYVDGGRDDPGEASRKLAGEPEPPALSGSGPERGVEPR